MRLDARLTPHRPALLGELGWSALQTALTGGLGEALALAEDWRRRAPEDARLDIVELRLTWNDDEAVLSGSLRPGAGAVLPVEADLEMHYRGLQHPLRLAETAGRATVNGHDLATWLADLLAGGDYGERIVNPE